MRSVERSVMIEAPVDAVWAVLRDFDTISSWAPNVDHSCSLSEQTEGVGTVRRIQAQGRTVVETVQAWEPGKVLSYQITGLPPIIRSLTNTWNLEPSGDTTDVVLITVVDAGPRPPQQLIAQAVCRQLAKASDHMLEGLKSRVERSSITNESEEL